MDGNRDIVNAHLKISQAIRYFYMTLSDSIGDVPLLGGGFEGTQLSPVLELLPNVFQRTA
jgi:hypothetical protein